MHTPSLSAFIHIFSIGYFQIFTWNYAVGFPDGSVGEESACNTGDTGGRVWTVDCEDPVEKEMATHSSILAWKIPWTGEL